MNLFSDNLNWTSDTSGAQNKPPTLNTEASFMFSPTLGNTIRDHFKMPFIVKL